MPKSENAWVVWRPGGVPTACRAVEIVGFDDEHLLSHAQALLDRWPKDVRYVLEGELTLLSPDGELKAGPGTFVHLPRGAAHGFLNAADTPSRMLVITTPGGNLEGVFRDLDAAKSPAPEEVGAICAAHRIPMV